MATGPGNRRKGQVPGMHGPTEPPVASLVPQELRPAGEKRGLVSATVPHSPPTLGDPALLHTRMETVMWIRTPTFALRYTLLATFPPATAIVDPRS